MAARSCGRLGRHCLSRLLPTADQRDRALAYGAWTLCVGLFAALTLLYLRDLERQREEPPTQVALRRVAFPMPAVLVCSRPEEIEANFDFNLSACLYDGVQCEVMRVPVRESCNPADDYCYAEGDCIAFVPPEGASPSSVRVDLMAAVVFRPNTSGGLGSTISVDGSPGNLPLFIAAAAASLSGLRVSLVTLERFISGEPLEETMVFYPGAAHIQLQPLLRVPLSGADEWTFRAAYSTVQSAPGNSTAAAGAEMMLMTVTPATMHVTVYTEVDPWNIYVVFGVVSGFWSIAMIVYRLTFTSKTPAVVVGAWRSGNASGSAVHPKYADEGARIGSGRSGAAS